MHVAFEDDLGGGGNFEVYRFALYQLYRLLAEKAGDQIFLNIGWSRDDRGKSDGGGGAAKDRDLHFAGRMVPFPQDLSFRNNGHDANAEGGSSGRARGCDVLCVRAPGLAVKF